MVEPVRRRRRPSAWPWTGRFAWTGAAILLTGCELTDRVFPDPVTEDGDELLSLWWGSSIAALVVALVVWGLIVFAVVRYRRGRGERRPSQSASNIPVEIVYTVIPIVIVAVLFAFSYRTQQDVTDTEPAPDLVVDVVAFQWQWRFVYPQGVTITGTYDEPPVMVLPVGKRVRFRLFTTDVIHSLWVPQFLTKRDMIPGIENEFDVVVEERGQWVGRCAEFCGLDHYRMTLAVRAVPPSEYETWLTERRLDDSRERAAGR